MKLALIKVVVYSIFVVLYVFMILMSAYAMFKTKKYVDYSLMMAYSFLNFLFAGIGLIIVLWTKTLTECTWFNLYYGVYLAVQPVTVILMFVFLWRIIKEQLPTQKAPPTGEQ